ncbi:MAG: DUF975 family protein, partial [Pseudoflavonifractor sp.]
INRKDLKRAAWGKIRGVHPSPMLVTLLFLLLGSGIGLAVDFVVANPAETVQMLARSVALGGEEMMAAATDAVGSSTIVALFLNVLMFLYTSVLAYGYCAYTLRRTDGEAAGYSNLLDGFSSVGRVIGMQILIMGFTMVWSMAVMMPLTMLGIFLVLMAMMIRESLAVVGLLLFVPCLIAGMLLLEYFILRYALAPYLLADHPEMGGMEAVRRSRQLLRGHSGELFKLMLSFFGWQLLAGVISLVGGGLVGGGMMAAGFAAGGGQLVTVGAYVFVIVAFLAGIPLSLVITPYYHGTLAEYYRALLPQAQPLTEPELPETF